MKGFVYVIRSHQTDDVYYGSTIQMLCRRMAEHRSCYKRWLNGDYVYMTSYDVLKYDDAYIELVEEVNFENKKELHAREGHHIRENNCVNKIITNRTKAEYNKMYNTKWRENHAEEIKEYSTRYYEQNKEEIKEKKRLYREANIEMIKEKGREYDRLRRLKKKAES